jgi:hypothetical protein
MYRLSLITALALTCAHTAYSIDTDSRNILWVIDNSASLGETRKVLGASMEKFLESLTAHGIKNYEMAITTTDGFTGLGKLVQTGALRSVTAQSKTPAHDMSKLVGTIEETSTSFWEQGLESSRAALRGDASFLVRKDVPLAVIYVTDENDYSCQKDCFGVEPENNQNWVPFPLKRYTDFFRQLEHRQGVPVSIYSVVSTTDSPCALPSLGERYSTLVSKIGYGLSTSVCKSAIEKGLLKIADDLAL